MDVRSDVWNFKSLKGKVYEVIPINNLSFKYKPIVLVSLIFRFMHRDLKIVCNFFYVCTSRGSPVLRQRFPVCCERCGHLQRSSTRRPYEFWYLPDECWKPEISKMIVKVRIARCIGQCWFCICIFVFISLGGMYQVVMGVFSEHPVKICAPLFSLFWISLTHWQTHWIMF